jgi:uncharacterized NAD-dependent epimerase/dehydratase family protein
MGKLTNPDIRCVGVALNTSKVPLAERATLLTQYSTQIGLPCVDPMIDGVGPIMDRVESDFFA